MGHSTNAQDIAIDRELEKIDSLILYNRLDTAQMKSDSLYNLLNDFNSRKKHKNTLLELNFRKILILDRKDISPVYVLDKLKELSDRLENTRLYSLTYRTYLLLALTHEKANNFELTDKYLNEAFQLYQKHNLESLYSTYCIRKSSYYRFIENLDSTFYYAKKGNEYALKYENETDLVDSYILLGYAANKTMNHQNALEFNLKLLDYRKKNKDKSLIAITFNNIALTYFKMGDFHQAMKYSDSALIFKNFITFNPIYEYSFPEVRYQIFEGLNNKDSANYYLKLYIQDYKLMKDEDEKTKTKELEEQYQNEKKEAIIKSKNRQMLLIIGLLALIAFSAFLLNFKNREISRRNKIINEQLAELTKTLDQKQVLLSELQHRVKNNLQHVISILEIQKESVDFNNIDELIRGNQNRIHSMALLHQKLNVTDFENEVDLTRYITELAELVKDSYDDHKSTISLSVRCSIKTISLEKALPLGLIIVELVSNSMKHAFKNRNTGIINIELSHDITGNKLFYADNGTGFDFNATNGKGLGQEIIKGLIDQLDGTTESSKDKGFELTIYFN